MCVCALALAACGDARDRAAHAPAHAPPPARPRPEQLVFMSRNTEIGVPEDIVVYANGHVDYRFLLHTKITMKVRTAQLTPAALARMRRLVARTRLDHAQRLGAEPPPGGFRYLLRIGGRSITTVDGRLTPGVRPLIRRLARMQDRLLVRGE